MAQPAGLTAVLLIAHGSRHAPANDDLHQLAARFAARGNHPIVEPSFLELAAPDIQEGGDRCVALGAARVLMIPYFLSAGVHLLRDLAEARDALRVRHPGIEFRLGPALGPHPLLEALVAERIARLDDGEEPLALTSSPDLAMLYETFSDHQAVPAAGDAARLDTIRPKD